MNNPKKILIVEDEVLIAKVYFTQINKHQLAQAYTCSGISEANKLLAENHFDLYVLDVNLKNGESGIDFAENLRKNTSNYIIFTTGNSNLEVDIKLKEISNSTVLLKPVNFEHLLKIIKENL